MSRWIIGFLTALGLTGAGALALRHVTRTARTQVQLDRFTIEIDRPGLPAHGLIILHLSDFHFHAGGAVEESKIRHLRELLAAEQYDVVALTGDLIHDIEGLPTALQLIRTLRPRLAIYFCPGNHDYAEYTPWGVFGHTWRESAAGSLSLRDLPHVIAALAAFAGKVVRNELVRMPIRFNDMSVIVQRLAAEGVTPLVNRSTRLTADGVDLWFAGVDDEMESQPDLAAALEDVAPGAPLVLLAHNPDIWLHCGVDRADLVLAGHTHGGQIQIPGVGAIHTQGTHLTRREPAGWFTRGRTKMFVSRGLGESIPLRFRASPQAALITLVPAAARPAER